MTITPAWPFNVLGQAAVPGREPKLEWHRVSPGYFQALDIPVLAGRDFDLRDDVNRENVIIVDDVLVEHYFPGENPIGRQRPCYRTRRASVHEQSILSAFDWLKVRSLLPRNCAHRH
ncbi:MAG: hypothetical protein JO077_15720 [Verrucomicrobia bacterium]|nr:hypothetical protein [Verrucomicrobiota bacterium]